jgi:hypothetical protein
MKGGKNGLSFNWPFEPRKGAVRKRKPEKNINSQPYAANGNINAERDLAVMVPPTTANRSSALLTADKSFIYNGYSLSTFFRDPRGGYSFNDQE